MSSIKRITGAVVATAALVSGLSASSSASPMATTTFKGLSKRSRGSWRRA